MPNHMTIHRRGTSKSSDDHSRTEIAYHPSEVLGLPLRNSTKRSEVRPFSPTQNSSTSTSAVVGEKVRMRGPILVAFLTIVPLLFMETKSVQAETDIAALEKLGLTGQYEQAVEEFQKVIADDDTNVGIRSLAALRLSQVHQETGEYEAAIEVVTTALKEKRDSSRLWAQLAKLHFEMGEYVRCRREVRKALDLESQNPFAKLVNAKLLAESGQIDEAMNEYRWFVRHYNRAQPTDWETLMVISDGAAEYARWDRATPIFKFIVNTLCKDALKDNENCWQAAMMSGSLLLEKYNEGQALPEFEAALKINPNCAVAHLGFATAALQNHKLDVADAFADKALGANPQLVDALLIKADVQILSENDDVAAVFVEKAFAVNPLDQSVLARKAAMNLLASDLPSEEELSSVLSNLSDHDSWQLDADSEFATILKSITLLNQKPGKFLEQVGSLLDARRKYEVAELFYEAAIEVMPQLSAPRTALGMLAMRTGDIEGAHRILNDAFEADPFHVRVSNMRKVVDLLQSYEAIASDHFVVHIAAKDKALGLQMSNYLEEIYPELVERYGYEPPTRTQFEIYSDTEGQGAHAWFSTRMVGLPWIQTIGASTGKIVALANPTQTQTPFNWARVLRHEFVHILTLQKTRFNIPHWYTEAIAVTEEQVEPPERWHELLMERVPRGDLFNLKNLNTGFQRPKKASDWTMAYCQSRLYAMYLQQKYGEDSLRTLLDAYVETPVTADAFRQAFNVELDEIETEYDTFIKEKTAYYAKGRRPILPSLEAAKKAVAKDSDDPQVLAEMAQAALKSRDAALAEEYIQKALDIDPHHPLANTVLAQLHVIGKDIDAAVESLEQGLNIVQPEATLLDMLTKQYIEDGEDELAEQLLITAIAAFPHETKFYQRLVKIADDIGYTNEQLKPLLETIAERNYEDVSSRKQLARIAIEEQNQDAILKWAREATYVDALDPQMHRALAETYRDQSNVSQALSAYEVLLLLNEFTTEDRFSYGALLKRNKQREAAKEQLLKVLEANPDHAEVRTLIKLIDQGL